MNMKLMKMNGVNESVTRCGVRTHDLMWEPDLKSGALTSRPTWYFVLQG